MIKIKTKSSKRLGRGYGSGKGGHTSSRGQKGQKSRGSLNILFEGVKVKKSFIKKLPVLRGKGKFKASNKPFVITFDDLVDFKSGSKVDLEALVKAGVVDEKTAHSRGVKLLNSGKITKKLSILLPVSKSAQKIIEKAGGEILK